ncbi:MAG: sulfur carrier protein ThiS [Verrucomicrobiota bacterium]
MTVTINGNEETIEEQSLTIDQLLRRLGVDYPVLVEHNGTALFEREFGDSKVGEGDRIELLRIAAGG